MNTNGPSLRLLRARECSGGGGAARAWLSLRTREMAVAAGRTGLEVTHADYERARFELTGESDRERQDAILDSAVESDQGLFGLSDWENEGGSMMAELEGVA